MFIIAVCVIFLIKFVRELLQNPEHFLGKVGLGPLDSRRPDLEAWGCFRWNLNLRLWTVLELSIGSIHVGKA